MPRLLFCLSAFVLGSLPVKARSEALLEAFQAGNAAYAGEQYLEAVKIYEKAMEDSQESSLALLFNLGNAYYHLQDFPSALLSYERALTLDPGNPEVVANLQKVIEQSNLSRPDYSVAQEFAYSLSLRTWLRLLLLASAITTLAGILIWFAPKLSPVPNLALYLSIPLLLCAVTGLLLWKQDFSRALILQPNSAIRVAPTESANVLDNLPNGTWVTVLETHEPYHYIRTADKQEGWVNDVTLGEIWPNTPLGSAP